ncbi:MAG TPA: hypothetical protein VK498_12520 [Ferruginibacter sp.]|nr:hypothetical protein [Ferruginibacter sp.]
MKNTITLLLILVGCAANAQFSLQPQIGLENSKTTIHSNESGSFSPGMKFAPRLGLLMNYSFKSGHGGFFGISTNSQAAELKFADPQSILSNYTISGKSLQPVLEGGYQFRSKPISLGSCHSAASSSSNSCKNKSSCAGKISHCQNISMSHCSKPSSKSNVSGKTLYMRIIPAAGIVYKPTGAGKIESETKNGQTTYEYNADARTALKAGTSFEFGSLNRPKFVISINYLKNLGNSEETINSVSNGKTQATTFRTRSSAFNVSLGFPLNFSKATSSSQKRGCHRSSPSRCGQYRIYNQ